MTQTRILYATVFLVSIVSVICIYFFGIVPRLASYEVVVQEEATLRNRINELEQAFSGVKPQRAINAWSNQVQPWSVALVDRLEYFDSVPDFEPITIPEEDKDFPKFFYRRKFPELVQELEDDAFNAGCSLPNLQFGAANPMQVSDPSIDQVEKWLNEFKFGAELARTVVDANAVSLNKLEMSDEVGLVVVPEGKVLLERVYYEIEISTENLVEFLNEIHERDRFISILGFSIAKRDLTDGDAPLNFRFQLARTRFVPAVVTDQATGGATQLIRRGVSVTQSKATGSAFGVREYTEEELARIRAASDYDISFFESILRWFGF